MNFFWVHWPYFKKRQSEHVVHHHICSSLTLCEFLDQKKRKIVISFTPYLRDLVPCEFSFPRTQDCINGEEMLWYYHDLRKITGCICLVSNNALHKMLQVNDTVAGFNVWIPKEAIWKVKSLTRMYSLLWGRNKFILENIWLQNIYEHFLTSAVVQLAVKGFIYALNFFHNRIKFK